MATPGTVSRVIRNATYSKKIRSVAEKNPKVGPGKDCHGKLNAWAVHGVSTDLKITG